LQNHRAAQTAHHFAAAAGQPSYPQFTSAPRSPVISLPETERKAIVRALEATSGVRSEAAKQLGIGRTTLYRKMKEYGVA
jgi:transcriptional regulator of acetoin/glycerol metabolism